MKTSILLFTGSRCIFFKYPGQIKHATMVSQLFSYGRLTSILHDLTNEGNLGREKKKKDLNFIWTTHGTTQTYTVKLLIISAVV